MSRLCRLPVRLTIDRMLRSGSRQESDAVLFQARRTWVSPAHRRSGRRTYPAARLWTRSTGKSRPQSVPRRRRPLVGCGPTPGSGPPSNGCPQQRAGPPVAQRMRDPSIRCPVAHHCRQRRSAQIESGRETAALMWSHRVYPACLKCPHI